MRLKIGLDFLCEQAQHLLATTGFISEKGPQTAAHQASPSLGFSRQEHWSGLPFASPMHESEK